MGLALKQLGYSVNTTDTGQLDQAIALLKQQKPNVRTYTNDTVTTMIGGDVWIGMIWAGDLYQINQENEKDRLLHPRGGQCPRLRYGGHLSRAPSTRSRRTCSSTTCSTHTSARRTRTSIGYMGPNEAAKQYIDKAILDDPTVNPDKAILDKLEELLDMPNSVDEEYLSRWQSLRAG